MEETENKKVYLIDSENVGDIWVTHIMEFAEPQDEIVVFYTQKSPYMSYENIRKLMETDRDIIFIKCVEGQNALDFQLVTELGYRIGNEEDEVEYIVVTNDTGFDAAVRYWKAKGKLVKRYNVRFCQNLLAQHKNRNENKEKKTAENTLTKNTKEIFLEEEGETTLKEEVVQEEKRMEIEEAPQDKKTTKTEKVILKEKKAKTKEVEQKEKTDEVEETVQEEQMAKTEKESKEEKIVKSEEEPDKLEEAVQEEKSDKPEEVIQEEKPDEPEEVIQEKQTAKIEKVAKEDQISEMKEKSQEEESVKPEETSLEEKEQNIEELICNLLSCVGKKNIPDFHNALIAFLGQEKGKALYKQIKGNLSGYKTKNMKEKEKFKVYCQMVFLQDSVEESYPNNFSNFVYEAKEKRGNLNTFRAAVLEKYGKEKGMIYYNIIKPHVKILNRIQKVK